MIECHVVKQKDVRFGGDGFTHLRQRVTLDGNGHCVWNGFSGAFDGGSNPSRCGDMVVLDHHGGVEGVAVIMSASNFYGVSLKGAQSGRGLAGVHDSHPAPLHQ